MTCSETLDIEDIIGSSTIGFDDEYAGLNSKVVNTTPSRVAIKRKPTKIQPDRHWRNRKQSEQNPKEQREESSAESSGIEDDIEELPLERKPATNIPGKGRIFVKSWGCSHNHSDGEYMAGQLSAYGFEVSLEDNAAVRERADLWLLNSCTVKNPAEDHFRNEIEKGQRMGKALVLAGCVPQAQPRSEYMKGLSVVGVQQIDRIVEVVEESLNGNSVRLFASKRTVNPEDGRSRKAGGASLALPKIRRNPWVEIIPISTGCLNQCTYCKTKHARGVLGSYPVEDIVERARTALAEGCVEVWLTSEDLGAYGRDIGLTLPDLLRPLVKVFPKNTRLRLGMTNPPYILDHLEEVAAVLREECVYKFLHVPVQSGSDSVLWAMRREYTRADFERVVDEMRRLVPGITIATDLICGFPTETEQDFEETISLVEKYRFPSLFINQFYPRPKTAAARLKRLPTNIVKQRTRRVTQLFHSYETYSHCVGQNCVVLVTEEAHDKKHLVGHDAFYQQVLLPKDKSLLGRMVEVRITSSGKHFLVGDVVRLVDDNSRTDGIDQLPGWVVPKLLDSGVYSMGFLRRTNYWYYSAFLLFVGVLFLYRIGCFVFKLFYDHY